MKIRKSKSIKVKKNLLVCDHFFDFLNQPLGDFLIIEGFMNYHNIYGGRSVLF